MRTKRAPCRARGTKGGDGFEAANEAAMAAEAAHACADHRATSFGALRGRAGGLIASVTEEARRCPRRRAASPAPARLAAVPPVGPPRSQGDD